MNTVSPRTRGPLLQLWALWDRPWLAPRPALGLALLRVVTFGTLLYFAAREAEWLMPLRYVDPWFYRPIMLFEWLGIGPLPPELAAPLRWALSGAAIIGLLGLYARAVAVLCALGYAYAIGQMYSYTSVHHGDALLLLALVLCALSPTDAVLALRPPWRALVAAPLAPAATAPGWPILFIRVQIALTYWLAGYAKLVVGGVGWADGATLQYYLLLRGQPLGWWVAQSPELCLLLSVGSLVWELVFPLVLFWPRTAWVLVPAAVAFHLGSQTLLGLGFYHFLPFLLLFIEPEALLPPLAAWRTRQRDRLQTVPTG